MQQQQKHPAPAGPAPPAAVHAMRAWWDVCPGLAAVWVAAAMILLAAALAVRIQPQAAVASGTLASYSSGHTAGLVLPRPIISPRGVYRVFSDLDEHDTRDMVAELELCHAEFVRRLDAFLPEPPPGLRERQGGPLDVYLFRRHEDYLRFTGGMFPNSGGLFMSQKRALAVYLEGQGRYQMRKTLRHEAFHQYAHERFGDRLPVWLNEGLAQLFEEGVRITVPGDGDGRRDELRLGQVPPDRLRQLQHDHAAGRLIEFDHLTAMNDRAWSRTMADRGHAATQYTQAWAMVHMLIYATDGRGQPVYRDRFNAMLRDIAAGRQGQVAFRDHFGTNFAGFRQRFERYIGELSATTEAAQLDHQRVLAELLMLLHERGVRFTSIEQFRRHVIDRGYRLEMQRDQVSWSTDADVGVYFRDLQGRMLEERRLGLRPDPAGELPMIVRQPGDGLVYRTRFHRLDGRLMYETVVESERQ